MRPIPAIDPARLARRLVGSPFEAKLLVYETVTSTNDECRRLAARGAPEGTTVIAEHQTAGRGRHGRHWYSAPRSGLYVSTLFRPADPPSRASRWTLGVAVAAAESCRAVSGVAVTIKWPNDLHHEGAKLGGILAELRGTTGNGAELIVGTGINVGLQAADMPGELNGLATSLGLACGGRMLSREDLAVEYLARLGAVAEAMKNDNWDTIAGRWLRLAPAARGAHVRIRAEPGADLWREGRTDGIDGAGALRVRLADGSCARVTDSRSVVPVEE